MSERDVADLGRLRLIGDYQFGAGAGRALFPAADALTIERSSSGRPRQVVGREGRLVTLGADGRFTLGIVGGRRLGDALAYPRGRVVVGDESEPFIRDGKNAFAKFVRDVDPEIRAGDEVLVVHERAADGAPDALLAVGRAELDAGAMLDFETGMVVKVRDGAGDD